MQHGMCVIVTVQFSFNGCYTAQEHLFQWVACTCAALVLNALVLGLVSHNTHCRKAVWRTLALNDL